MDLIEHLKRQIAFSRATFGPGERTKGVCEHIRRELAEVEGSNGSPEEWVDVAILALDGLTRSLVARDFGHAGAAIRAAAMIAQKQETNEMRDWPDWRGQSEDAPIEHVREG